LHFAQLCNTRIITKESFYFEGPDTQTGNVVAWNPQSIYNPTNDAVVGSITGSCDSTQSSPVAADCQFIIKLKGSELTFSGNLQTPLLNTNLVGVMSITGGTGSLVGAVGDVELTSFFVGNNFLASGRFDANAVVSIVDCLCK
jgi:hypothetical protein